MIAIYEKNFPQLTDLESMALLNSHGGSLAWRENNKIRYEKNITAKEIMHIIEAQKIQLPLIVHFRIASVGSVSPELCHPFPITANVELDLNNQSEAVLFHNGTWAGWSDYLIRVCIAKNIHAPSGKISDSRIMAWLAYHYGFNFVTSVIDQSDKVVIFTPTDILRLGSFENYQEKCEVSNNFFVRSEEKDLDYGIWGGYGGYFGQESLQDSKLSKKDRKALKKLSKKKQKKINDNGLVKLSDQIYDLHHLNNYQKQLVNELMADHGYSHWDIMQALEINNHNFDLTYEYLLQLSGRSWERAYE